MRLSIYLLSCLIMILASGCAHASQVLMPVASQGETIVAATDGKMNIQVRIIAREVQIGKPSQEKPSDILTSCTYSKYPCSIVDSIEININRNQLYIPRSVFCDLADLNRAEVNAGKKMAVLTLYGGDASESYVVKIEFDSNEVKRRILYSAMSPNKPLQETTYYMQVLGD